MMKNNKWKLILSSAIVLLPIVMGLIFWNTLPEQFATHWGADGVVDGWSNKAFTVFALPGFIFAIHWLCIFVSCADPMNKNQGGKALGLVLWICPAISVFSSGVIYATALGMESRIELVVPAGLGLLFAIIGNYLPKCKQNYTIGIKLPWTLHNEENWNKTHRFAGKMWVIGGLVLMASIFLPKSLVVIRIPLVIILLAIVPIIYSYAFYRNQLKNEDLRTPDSQPMHKPSPLYVKVSIVFGALILVAVGILLFTGNIEMQYGETSFTIKATYWSDLEVDYGAIESIEYRQACVAGSRTNGFGSRRLQMGAFRNDEFGAYTRYSYTDCDSCVVLKVSGNTLAVSGIDEKSTEAIYDELMARIKK